MDKRTNIDPILSYSNYLESIFILFFDLQEVVPCGVLKRL
jgi:hypothetical protein